MSVLSHEAEQELLNYYYEKYHKIEGVIAIETSADGDFTIVTIRVLAGETGFEDRVSAGQVVVDSRTSQGTVKIIEEWVFTPGIIDHAFRNSRDGEDDAGTSQPELEHGQMIVGGSRIWHSRLDGWGTLAFTARRITARNSRECDVQNAAMSNNHVLALWDRARQGDRIDATSHRGFGTLACWLPVTNTHKNNDTAFAEIDTSHTRFLEIRGIGRVERIVAPRRRIQVAKSGARTGVTYGEVTGFASIRVNDRWFRGVGKTSRGMACPGDSGSAVVSRDGRIFYGLHFAGEDIPCDRRPVGYFIPALPPSNFTTGLADELIIYSEEGPLPTDSL